MFGLPRVRSWGWGPLHAYTVFECERSQREKLYQDQYIPTAWNQIEASMAIALQVPILVLREGRLHREGIFERRKTIATKSARLNWRLKPKG